MNQTIVKNLTIDQISKSITKYDKNEIKKMIQFMIENNKIYIIFQAIYCLLKHVFFNFNNYV